MLDTHCWLWSLLDPDRLNSNARELISNRSHDVLLSAVSSWEIAIKFALGKLDLPEPPAQYVPSRLRLQGLSSLPIQHAHALAVTELPDHHRDPFDRLLIAQARAEDLTLLTADPIFERYSVELVWAA